MSLTTEEIVRQIRELEGVYSAYTVAKWFNIDATTVQHIWANQVYKFAGEEDTGTDVELEDEEFDEDDCSEFDELDEKSLFSYSHREAWGEDDG